MLHRVFAAITFLLCAASAFCSLARTGRVHLAWRKCLSSVLIPLCTFAALPAAAVSPNIVISQVYGANGNVYESDYVELFNRSASAVSVAGWSVQYASATGTGNFALAGALSGTIPAGGYYLIKLATTAGSGAVLPAAQTTAATNISGTNGKVIIANVNTAIACNGGSTVCSAGQLAQIVDLVGYGTANFFEGGGAAPAASTTLAIFRTGNGCTDTDVNSADVATGVPAPRNAATTPAPCVVGPALPNLTINDVSLSEGNAGTTSFTFTVSLSAPAGAGGVTFDIATADGTATQPSDYTAKSLTGQTIPAGSSTYSFTVLVNGDTTPETNETFVVNVTNVTGATITDGQGQGTITNDDAAPNLTINDVTLNEGNAGTTTFTFTVSLSAPAPAGGVTFDIATANNTAVAPGDYTAKSPTSQTIPAGSSTYTFDVLVNGDTTPETDETFFVNVTNITNAIGVDTQGLGTIVNDDITFIHDVQGNGAATPIPGATVTVEGIVVGNFQGSTKLSGFFLQEEDSDADADPNTSEGIFIYCNTCPTAVAEGQRVRVTGVVSEFFNMTQITASTAGSVVVTNAGNNLALVTPSVISLPIAGDVNAFYEAREGMRVTFVDTLAVSEYFELARYGTIELYQGGRPLQFTETSAPSIAGNAAYAAALAARRVILDDDNDIENVSVLPAGGQADGSQFIYYPRTNGGFSNGTQGADFFRGGDLVNGLTGVLHWSFSGGTSPSAWRIRPTAASPVTFTVANPRPATPPVVGGAIKAVSMNMLNYFTTIDTTSSNSTGPCGPGGTLDCRGADSVAELNRQRERASVVICSLNAHVYGLMEMENTTPSATVTDLLGAVNARCGGANPFASVNTGGTLGTDAIRVNIIYRTGVLSPVGAPLADLDPIHSRPPLAQTFDVVDAVNSAFGQRFTVIANHLKSKGSSAGLPGDADSGDGQGASAATRTAQAARLLAWTNSTVIPAAGDPDVLLLGDFNSYAMEPPVTTITGGGYTDLASALLGPGTYSYLFDGQLGHLDYAFASSSLTPQVTGVGIWHINADESDLFDYNDEIKDTGEAAFEEKPDGSARTPPRVMFLPASPYRASDHDPVLVGLFLIADLAITKTDSPDPVTAGTNLTYTITVTNNGPDMATTASWSDTLPAGTTFVSLPAVGGWSCTTPAVGAGGTVSCSNPSYAVGSAVFTLTVNVGATVTAGTVLSNTATTTSASGDADLGNNSATATTTVAASADLSVTKLDTPDPVTAGNNLTYTITVSNAGPSNAASVDLGDVLPSGTTFVSLASPGGWTCTTPAVGAAGTVSCVTATMALGNAVFTLTVNVGAAVANGTVLSNTATVSSQTTDPNGANNSATATTTVIGLAADLGVTLTDSPDPVGAGNTITYTITVTNAGPNPAASATMNNLIPAGTTFASLITPSGWSCTFPAVGSGGTIACSSLAAMPVASSVFTLVVTVSPSAASGSPITDTATVASATADPAMGNNSATSTTGVIVAAMSPAFTVVPTAVSPGQMLSGLTLTCTNSGGSIANSPTCLPSANVGTVSAIVCSPSSATLAGGAAITCTFSYLAPGTAGGGDEGAPSVVFTGLTSAANANGGTPSTATATAQVIDALNDAPAAVQNNIANSVNLIANDTVGGSAASASGMVSNVTVSPNGAVTCATCVGAPTALTVAANGTVTVPALAVAGTYLVPYQICASPANATPLAAACDTAVATIIVQGADMVSSISCTPTSGLAGTPVNCTATCTNNGPAMAVNAVCAILNVGSLPAGASVPMCTGSPAASLASGASLTCTVSFAMPSSANVFTVSAGGAADNDPLGGNNPSAAVNNLSAVSVIALLAVQPVPATNVASLVLLVLLLLAGFAIGRKRLR